MNEYPRLFEPLMLGNTVMPNRIALAPMGALLGDEQGFTSERAVKFYEERAAGGAGLIVIENTCVEWPKGKANTAQTRTDVSRAVTGLRAISERVQYYGSLVAAQLQHAGGQTTLERTEGTHPYAASPVVMKEGLVPDEMTKEEIAHVIKCFAQSTFTTKRAGFNCVEIHGAHGYLVSEFLSPILNKRKDEYGGDVKKRVRFAVEMIDEIVKAVGKNFPIIMRINGSDRYEGGITIDEVQYIGRALEEAGAAALSISTGLNSLSRDWVFPTEIHGFGTNLPFAEAVKKVVKIPVGVAGRIVSPKHAEEILQDGKADFVVIGRPLIADPQWGNKAYLGKADKIRPCLYCNNGCTKHHHNNWRLSCDINVEAGRELEWLTIKPAARTLDIAVVGGGPGGMEAARRASMRGHHVSLYEKDAKLGGQLNIADIPAHKQRLKEYEQYLSNELKRLKVKVFCNTEVDTKFLKKLDVDGVVYAAGAKCRTSDHLKLTGKTKTMTAWDVFLYGPGDAKEVTIIGGGHVGVDLALFLREKGDGPNVRLVELLEEILPGTDPGTKMSLVHALEERQVEIITASQAKQTDTANQIEITSRKTGEKTVVSSDLLVVAVGAEACALPSVDKKQLPYPVIQVGDTIHPRGIWEATHEGTYAVLQIERWNDLMRD